MEKLTEFQKLLLAGAATIGFGIASIWVPMCGLAAFYFGYSTYCKISEMIE
jgi:hypothetical protein